MTSDRDKCGLTSLLPMSCRGTAEEFARQLHSRLTSLGSRDNNGTVDENSWLAPPENPITLSQPRQSDADLFFDLGNLESPDSPEDELDEPELEKIINQEKLKLFHSNDCHCSISKEKNLNLFSGVTATSYDSDSSDGVFYDSENDLYQQTVVPQIQRTAQTDNNLNNSDKTKTSNDETIANQIDAAFSEINFSDCNLLVNDNAPISECTDPFPEVFEPEKTDTEEVCKTDINGESCLAVNGETYSSCLTIENNYTVECPNVILTPNEDFAKSEIKESVQNSISDDSNDNEDTEPIPRVRRCSSLKTGKTPPGTPGRKKIVRFADVLGLDLADVRTFLDEIPKIPNSAYNDLKDVDLNESTVDVNLNTPFNKFHGIKVDKLLVALFQQPGGQPDFIEKIRNNQVCLDNALVEDPVALTITGTVRVKNLDFHKSVHIRYTLDSWQTFADVQATYVENSCDGFSDKFSFLLFAHTLAVGQRLEFAIRFQCKGNQYWDNNSGINYCFQCLPATNNTMSAPITETETLGASFYY